MFRTLMALILFALALLLITPTPSPAFDAFAWVTGDTKQVVYMTSDNHIHELSYNLHEGFWRCADLSALADAPTPAGGFPVGFEWAVGGVKQVLYKTLRPNAVISLVERSFERDNQWHYKDLFQVTGQPRRPFGGFSAFSQNTLEGTKQVVYVGGGTPRGRQNHVWELRFGLDGQWRVTDLTEVTGDPSPRPSTSTATLGRTRPAGRCCISSTTRSSN